MNLRNKKEHVLRCIRLGMDLYQAEILAECTVEEIEYLDKDEDFQLLVKQEAILEEYQLLEKHEIAMEIALSRGNTMAIQWKLEKLNPKKWGKEKEDESKKSPFEDEQLEINLVGRGNDGSER